MHTLRANVDYGFTEANTTYGKIGVKTWIFKGEILDLQEALSSEASTRRQQTSERSNTKDSRSQNRRGVTTGARRRIGNETKDAVIAVGNKRIITSEKITKQLDCFVQTFHGPI